MNPFKIVVSFIVLLYLFFFISNIFFPAAFPKQGIVEKLNGQIELSKKNLGIYNSEYDLKLEKGISLSKQDFESNNTVIEFECNSYEFCCAENEKCDSRSEWTKDFIKFNKTINPITSTRCENVKGTYFCDIYVGGVPAQVQSDGLNYNNNFYFDSDKLRISAEVTNKGNTTESFAVIEAVAAIAFNDNGTIKQEQIKKAVSTRTRIEPKETKTLETEIEFDSPGEYFIKAKITGLDFGFIEQEFTVNVLGTPAYDCRIDSTKKEIIIDDTTVSPTTITECTIRHYCSDCLYAFECKQAWKKVFQQKNFELGTKDFTTEKSRGTNCS